MPSIPEFNLLNKLLVATPSLDDPIFHQTVTYICEHNKEGVIGLIINKPIEMNVTTVFEQMNIPYDKDNPPQVPIMFGGPLKPERGFILHKPGGKWSSSLQTNNEYSITTSKDILESIAMNQGPKESLIILGYSSWENNQLVDELINNDWLHSSSSKEIIFEIPFENRWDYALQSIGINHINIQDEPGHA